MVDYSRYECIQVEHRDKILTLTLNRPQALNAVNSKLHTELAQIFADVQWDEEANVVVLTGAGRAFSAGGDIKWMEEMAKPATLQTVLWEGKKIINDLLELEKPIIAKVNGAATGLGATIALFCDIIISSTEGKFADPHVKVGVGAGDGGAVIWPLLIGVCKAKELLMTGDLIGAEEAERIGLINRVVPPDKLDETVQQMATRLANGAIRAIRATKVSVNKLLKANANLILDASLALEGHCFNTEDHREAVRAFIEKRQPRFTGK